jgi:tetratricopeptide (TPR) repeat protein
MEKVAKLYNYVSMKQFLFSTMLAVLIIIGLVMTNQPATTATSPEMIQTANDAYEASQFAVASQIYQQLVDQGIKNSDLYYNLGNSYFKQGEIGRAILNYRRAMKLNPHDADIQTNLAMAQERTQDQLDTTGETTFNKVAKSSENWLTMNEIAIISLSLWFGLALLIFVYSLPRVEKKQQEAILYGIFIVAFLWAVTTFVLGDRLYVEQTQQAGVVVIDKIDVNSGPGSAQYVTKFSLHSGTEVWLLESRGNWVLISLPGDKLEG